MPLSIFFTRPKANVRSEAHVGTACPHSFPSNPEILTESFKFKPTVQKAWKAIDGNDSVYWIVKHSSWRQISWGSCWGVCVYRGRGIFVNLIGYTGSPTSSCLLCGVRWNYFEGNWNGVWERFLSYTVSVTAGPRWTVGNKCKIRVLNRDRRPLGYLNVVKLKEKWESGEANQVMSSISLILELNNPF